MCLHFRCSAVPCTQLNIGLSHTTPVYTPTPQQRPRKTLQGARRSGGAAAAAQRCRQSGTARLWGGMSLGLARQCRRVAANDHRCWLRAGVSLVLVLALCVPVLGLKGQFRRLVDENGAIPHLSCPSLHFAAPSLECFLVQICIFAQHILPCVQ